MKKSIKLFMCAVCLTVMLSACATIPQPACPAKGEEPVCKVDEKGDQVLANLAVEGRHSSGSGATVRGYN